MTPAKVLVVEDDRVVARDIHHQLTRIGHAVVGMTARGEDALALALNVQPELVLMDIKLEGAVDGISAAQEIRERCQVPVVFLTAYADDETVRRAILTEPFGYLLKPFEDSQLRTVIEMSLYKHAAERRLRESERRYATTLSSIGDAVIATDERSRVTFMNPVAEALTGWRLDQARERLLADVFRIVNEASRETIEDPAAKVLRLGTVVGLANHTVLLARDGREVPIDDCGSPIIDDRGGIAGAVLVFRDITERRHADEAVRKAQGDLARVVRVTTMGELTVSIAHEVNQPLMAIGTDAEACVTWLERATPDIDEAKRAAQRVVRGCRRAADVVARISAFVRKSPPEMTEIDINEAIVETLDLMHTELRRNGVSLVTELSTGLAPIVGDRVQLQQVVLNLLVNGIEAIATTISPRRVLRVSSSDDGQGNALVTISDTGPGLDPAQRDQIFDAFFTTKPKGIGMGLPTCRSIIETHGGRMWAESNAPSGATFRFTVPSAGRDRA